MFLIISGKEVLFMRDDENPGGKGFPNGENEPLFIAHKSEDGTREEKVLEHLHETARLAEHFAGAFEAGDLGYLTGLVHDIGKYSRPHSGKTECTENHNEEFYSKCKNNILVCNTECPF